MELSLLCNSDVTAIVAGGLEQICEGGMKSYDPSEGDASMSRSLDEHLDACRRRHAQPRKRHSSGTTSAVSHRIWECSKCTGLCSKNAREPYPRRRLPATRKCILPAAAR